MKREVNSLIDLTGKRFNRWTVLEHTDRVTATGQRYWRCRCDCGQIQEVIGRNLRRGISNSCGCLVKEVLSRGRAKRRLPKGEAAFNCLLAVYKRGARRRNLIFALSREQFRQLVMGNCYYCGSPPASVQTGAGYNGAFVYNGVDRIDNKQGYYFENCVSCCRFCNFAKGRSTREEFEDWLERVRRSA